MISDEEHPQKKMDAFEIGIYAIELLAIAAKVVGVMHKDSSKFSETGGWGFEGFNGDTKERVVTDPKGACFNCHKAQKDKDYVFSEYLK